MQLSENITVAIQGGYGSFHHLAANTAFSKKKISLVTYGTFLELFIAIKANQVDYAVVAIDNTISGCLATNYPLIIDAGVSIVSELWLSVKQNLITLPGTALSSIKEIHSHPMAILQCRDFLEPFIHRGVKIVETSNTALSVKYIHDTKAVNIAAIGNAVAASLYRLDIIAENINTSFANYTRFLILSNPSRNLLEDDIQEHNKATVLFSTNNDERSIPHVLKLFSYGDCKITHLLSLPIIDSSMQQQFIADIVYDNSDVFENIIRLATTHGYQVKILGKYIHTQKPIYTACEA